MPVQFRRGVDGLDGRSASRSPWRGDPAAPVSTETHAVPWSPPWRAAGGCCHPRSPASGSAYLACPAARRVLDCRSRRKWGPTPQQCIERTAHRRRLTSTSSVAGSDVGGPIVRCRYGRIATIIGERRKQWRRTKSTRRRAVCIPLKSAARTAQDAAMNGSGSEILTDQFPEGTPNIAAAAHMIVAALDVDDRNRVPCGAQCPTLPIRCTEFAGHAGLHTFNPVYWGPA